MTAATEHERYVVHLTVAADDLPAARLLARAIGRSLAFLPELVLGQTTVSEEGGSEPRASGLLRPPAQRTPPLHPARGSPGRLHLVTRPQATQPGEPRRAAGTVMARDAAGVTARGRSPRTG